VCCCAISAPNIHTPKAVPGHRRIYLSPTGWQLLAKELC
jgi:hypothetical protein